MGSVHPYVELRLRFGRAMLEWIEYYGTDWVRVKLFADEMEFKAQDVVMLAREAGLRLRHLPNRRPQHGKGTKALAMELHGAKIHMWMGKGFPIPGVSVVACRPQVITVEELHRRGLLGNNVTVARFIKSLPDGKTAPVYQVAKRLGMPRFVVEAAAKTMGMSIVHTPSEGRRDTRAIWINHEAIEGWVQAVRDYREGRRGREAG